MPDEVMPDEASPAPSPAAETTKPISKSEMAQFLDVDERTIDRYMRQGLPYIKLGKPRFFLPDVMKYLRTKKTVRAVAS